MKYVVLLLSVFGLLASAATPPGRYIVEMSGEPAARVAGPQTRAARAARMTARASELRAQHSSLSRTIRQRGADVTGETTTATNTLFVTVPAGGSADLESVPGVRRVYPVRIRKPLLDRALPLQKVPDAWNQIGGMQNAGLGMKIAIIDTGIDVNHPGFNDPSLAVPEGFPKVNQDSDLAYTNQKIIVARAYAENRRGNYNANDAIGHGTGVAMTAAGVTTAGTYGIIAGVAPKAFLGNYKVFPDGDTGAPDDLILNAVDDAVADGMDVINLSLGSVPAPRPQDDIVVTAIQNAVASGVIVAIAAGNDGSDPGTIASPAIAPDAITVGSTSNDREFAGSLKADGDDPMKAIPGDGQNSSAPVTGPIVDISRFDSSGLGCDALPAGSLNGSIALVLRGVCFFEDKVNNVQRAGAIAALIYTDAARPDPIPMGVGAASLPATMISFENGSLVKQQVASGPLNGTIDFAPHSFDIDSRRISSFSSAGPNTDGNVKPDILAVGGTISTAQPLSMNGGFVVESGTSFSSPMLAGAAALLKAARPGLTTQQYRSLLINSASPFTLSSGLTATVEQTGAGLLNMQAALSSTITASPVSLNFGTGESSIDQTSTLTITNVGPVPDNFSITASASTGVNAIPAISPSTISLGPGESANIAVAFTASALDPGAYQGLLQVQSGQSPVVSGIPYWYAVRSSDPKYITILNQPVSGTRGSRQTIFLRIGDAAGTALFIDPAVTISSGGGSVSSIDNIDEVYPGVYAVSVRLGRTAGTNVFHIAVGELGQDITIAGN